MKISKEMAEDMGYLPSSLDAANREVEGQYIFGRHIKERFERAYRSSEERTRRKYAVDAMGLVEVPNAWLINYGHLAAPTNPQG